ncbi:MAG: hypothetical protein WD673_03980 [Alphaproteobacteria bacterium]
MSTYATEIAALEAALASGELSVEVEGRKVTYRSTSDLRSALAFFTAKAERAVPTQTTQSFATFTRA